MKKKIMIAVDIILVIAIIFGVVFLVNHFKGDTNKNVKATFYNFTLNEAFFQDLTDYKDRYDSLLVSSFGMDEETKNDIFENPEQWLAYNLFFNVENYDSEDIILASFENKNQGENGVYISTEFGSVQTVSNAAPAISYVTVLIHNVELSDAECEELVKSMNLYVGCAAYTDDFENISDKDISKVKVEF